MAKGEVIIQLDKTRTWKLSFNELATLEATVATRTGEKKSWVRFLADAANWTSEDYRLFYWVGLRRYDKELTEEQVGEWLDADTIEKTLGAMMESLVPESRRQKKVPEEATVSTLIGTASSAGVSSTATVPINSGS